MKRARPSHTIKRRVLHSGAIILVICLCTFTSHGQTCPPNIDFENGTFNGWTCYIGSTADVGGQNMISLSSSGGAFPGRHTMYAANSGAGTDLYGGFPVNCPNGSGHSIRLGNDQPGTEAEGVSYEFTIPANQNVYSLIYHYAVVFQDPNHQQQQQPRMEIEIKNMTDDSLINCSSFTFIPNGSGLPGFFQSPIMIDNTPIWCKDWSAVSINLDGHAGKTIRLFFKTADCTFRRHFGYAYIDVNTECSSEFIGATFCRDDTTVNVTAPHGYQGYTWYNSTFTQVLGTQQVLSFTPPPPPGTTIAVELVPYDGYGCLDTLFAHLIDTLTIQPNAGNDIISCNHDPVQIGANAKPGVVYSWSPIAGLSNPTISNPLANPAITTSYYLTTRHDGGGCMNTDTVVVRSSLVDNSLTLIGKDSWCAGSGDSSVLRVQPSTSVQWYENNAPVTGANQQEYRVIKTGSYHAVVFNTDGCSLATAQQDILIDKPRPGITYPVQYAVIDLPLVLEARQFGSGVLWSPAIHLDNPVSYTPIFTSDADQLYTIEIKTSSGCLTTDRQLVKTIPYVGLYVPSAFTPNNDGLNDFLRPLLLGIKELHYFRIYNRWGQLLYESRKELPGWDGKLKGIEQPTQVLVWMAEGFGVDKKLYREKGTSTLIR